MRCPASVLQHTTTAITGSPNKNNSSTRRRKNSDGIRVCVCVCRVLFDAMGDIISFDSRQCFLATCSESTYFSNQQPINQLNLWIFHFDFSPKPDYCVSITIIRWWWRWSLCARRRAYPNTKKINKRKTLFVSCSDRDTHRQHKRPDIFIFMAQRIGTSIAPHCPILTHTRHAHDYCCSVPVVEREIRCSSASDSVSGDKVVCWASCHIVVVAAAIRYAPELCLCVNENL